MNIQDIKLTFVGMESTQALKDYAIKKISKHNEYIEKTIGIDVNLVDRVKHKGKNKDFEIHIKVLLPKGFVNIKEVGDDLYKIIDNAEQILGKRFQRYYDKFKQWEGQQPWKVIEANEYIDNIEDEVLSNFESYIPKISVREQIYDMRPMEEAEAIEQMELAGTAQFLFKNKRTGKISMIYKRNDNSYGLTEPQDEL